MMIPNICNFVVYKDMNLLFVVTRLTHLTSLNNFLHKKEFMA